MAILDKVGKAVGKASQGLSDMAQSISSSAQETRDTIIRERQEKAIEQERKCPKCGNQLSGITAVCPLCGYEIKYAKTASSISELQKRFVWKEGMENWVAAEDVEELVCIFQNALSSSQVSE